MALVQMRRKELYALAVVELLEAWGFTQRRQRDAASWERQMTEQRFTDEDSKRLKARMCSREKSFALIARMEAAEDRWDWHYGAKRICACMRCEAWRKVSGK